MRLDAVVLARRYLWACRAFVATDPVPSSGPVAEYWAAVARLDGSRLPVAARLASLEQTADDLGLGEELRRFLDQWAPS